MLSKQEHTATSPVGLTISALTIIETHIAGARGVSASAEGPRPSHGPEVSGARRRSHEHALTPSVKYVCLQSIATALPGLGVRIAKPIFFFFFENLMSEGQRPEGFVIRCVASL